MTTQYTPILKLALPVQGELSGTWGDVVNDNITSMIEQAIAGRLVINTWSGNSHTLTTANGTTAEARAAMLTLTDSNTQLSAAGTVVCPALNKTYIVKNGAGQIITVKTASGSGIAIPNGKTMLVYCDGTNVLEGVDHVVTLSAGTLTITGLTTFASLKGADATTVTGILDEDNMASNSATKLATQQSIKAYVDAQVDTADTLAEILAIGNTTGSNDIDVDAAQKVQFRDAAIYINSSVDGQLDIVADTEIQIATATVDLNGNLDVSGTALVTGTLDVDGATQLDSTLTVGVNDTGHDVKFFGASSGSYMLWDESADDLILGGAAGLTVAGDLDVDGTTNLDVVDIDGAVQADGTITVGVNDTGYDVKFFGATAGKSLLWDESADSLIVTGDIKITQAAGGTFLKFDVDGTTDEATVGMDATDLIISVDPTNARASSDFIIKNDGTETFRIAANGVATFAGEITANGGITTDGITSSAPMTITLGGNNTQLTLESTDADATVGPRFDLHRNSASPAASDNLGQIRFLGEDSAGTLTSYAFINSFITNPADGAESGEIVIETRVGGANRPRFTANPTETSINEEGADLDFRVESDANTHAFFVDAGANKVGFNTSSPASVTGGIHVVHNAGEGTPTAIGSEVGIFQRNAVAAQSVSVSLISGTASTSSILFGDKDDIDAGELAWSNSSNSFSFSGGNVSVTGDVNTSGLLKVGSNDTEYANNYIRFKSAGAAFIDHLTVGQAINFRISTSSGLDTTPLILSPNTVIFNEAGLDKDFRVESDGASHALFVEGSSNYVGLNTSAPTQPLSLGTRTGANLNYIDGTTYSAATDTGIFVSGSTTNDQSTKLGMLLANNANNNSARSPIIGFSALSASNNYNHMYAAINGRKIGNGADTNWNHGQIEFCTSSGIGPNVRMILDYKGGLITKPTTAGHAVFNEDSVDADFRVESNDNAHMLFVDAGQNKVKIGSSADPAVGNAQLQVGAMGIHGALGLSGTNPNDTGIPINQGGSGGTALIVASNNTGNAQNTDSAVYMVKFFYDGNHTPSATKIAGDDFITIGKTGSSPNETMTLTNTAGGNGTVTIFMCT